jgi:hypothetical protein
VPNVFFTAATDLVTVQWVAPANGGDTISAFTIYIRNSDDLTFSVEPINCDGSDSDIVAALECNIPAALLHETPFSLPWGTDVHVKVSASNVKGESVHSLLGNGAIIIAVPDAPILLTEDDALRTSTTLGLTWSPGADDGSLTLIDYKITVQSQSGGAILEATSLNTAKYTAVSLTLGQTYDFIVYSRNSHGYSLQSATFSLLCAIKPSSPTGIISSNSGSNVVTSWTAPSNNGSPITAYQIYFKTSINTYVEELSLCDGSDDDIVSSNSCSVSLAVFEAAPYSL